MASLIDFDREYMKFAALKLRGKAEIKDEELTQALNDSMREWLDTKAEWLGGKTPDEYFAEMAPAALVDLMAEYCAAKMSVPEPLYRRIANAPECAKLLVQVVSDNNAHADARATALRLMCDLNCAETAEVCADALLFGDEIAEIATDWLKNAGYMAVELMESRYATATGDGKALIMDVLCSYPGVDATADKLIERLYNDRDRSAYYAVQAGRLGDERLLEPLMRLSQLSDIEYYDYKEIVNAIDALGGDPGEIREFYGDPDYEALRVADTMPNQEEN